MMQNFFGNVCKWMNEVLETEGKKICSIKNLAVTWVLSWEFLSFHVSRDDVSD
jgi:hypothetical protein